MSASVEDKRALARDGVTVPAAMGEVSPDKDPAKAACRQFDEVIEAYTWKR